jgi:phytoene dehydrogenase-like protein
MSSNFDAIIIGSGPNGLAAAIRLQQKGLATLVVEQAEKPGGATRTEELTLSGFHHDVCSSIHPLTIDSPFFKQLNLEQHGIEWITPEIAFAHPFSKGEACACFKDIRQTAEQFGRDEKKYLKIFEPLTEAWAGLDKDILGPLKWPEDPLRLMKFGLKALQPAKYFVNSHFKEEKTRTFFYGAAAHSTLPLNNLASASFGLVLVALGHYNGWPFPKNGAFKINEALISYYRSMGGKLQLGQKVAHLDDLPKAEAYIFDLTPRQLLQIGGTNFSSLYRKRLENYRYGAGVFKIDWALNDPIPWTNELCRKAGTVHIGFTPEEIERSERIIYKNQMSEQPYVLLAQHSVFDPTRAPENKHTVWAYCHVPNSSTADVTNYIEDQVERAAPGFKDCILKRSTHTTSEMEAFNPNLVGGDINGGMQNLSQLFTRPVARLSPYTTPDPKVFICSASTPPGGGVHGMCGYNAANAVIKRVFS